MSLFESRRPLLTLGTILRLDTFDGDILVILSREKLFSRDAVDASGRVGVTVVGSSFVPFQSKIEVLGDKDAQLVVVAHGKLGIGETGGSSTVGKVVGNLLILGEERLATDKEPLANGHIGLGLALFGSESVVVKREHRIKGTTQGSQFVCGTHLELGLGKLEVGSLFYIRLCERFVHGQDAIRNLDLRELARKKHAVYVGALRGILVGAIGRPSDEIDTPHIVLTLAVLAPEGHHTQTVQGSRVGLVGTSVVMLESLHGVVGGLVKHADAVLCTRISPVCGARITPKCLSLILGDAEAAKLEPHAAHKLGLRMMLVCQEAHDVHGVHLDLALDMRSSRSWRLRGLQALLVIHAGADVDQRVPSPFQLHVGIVGSEDRHPRIFQSSLDLVVARRHIG